MASAAVHTVVFCIVYFAPFDNRGLCCLGHVFCYAVLCPFYFCNHPAEDVRTGCLLAVCSLSHPHGAVGWSVVCECGISWPFLNWSWHRAVQSMASLRYSLSNNK